MDPRPPDPSPSVLERLEADGKPGPRLELRAAERESALAVTPIDLRRTGRYEALGEIARGGVGQIVKGRDVDLGRDVALKVLLEEHLGDADLLRRFVEEAQIGGQLQHPGIVPVYEMGLQGDRRPFFAMKLVKGRTLTALLSGRSDPSQDQRRILTIFEQICQTVAYAHTRGVIHRDLKPSNVMVGAFGEVQVLDWGFSKVLEQGGVADERRAMQAEREVTLIATVRSEGEGSRSVAGSVMGTPAYMPPEQALGHVGELDERSDVFSLGAILCEILTGKPPYTAEGHDRLVQAAQARLDDAHERLERCGGDAELVRLTRSCLEPLRQGRPPDAGEVAAVVTRHLAAVEERAHRSEVRAARARLRAEQAREEAAEQRRSRRQTRMLAAAILLALFVGGGAFFWIERDSRLREQRAARAVNEAVREVTLKRERGETEAALAAARRASELVRANEVEGNLRDQVAGLVIDLENEATVAREETRRRDLDDALVGQLEEIQLGVADRDDAARTDALFAAALVNVGIDAEAPGDAAVARLASSHRRVDLADALDGWAWLRRYEEELEGRPWEPLVAAARRIDPEGNNLRDVIRGGDLAQLRAMARSDTAESLSPRDLFRLCQSLDQAGDPEAAIGLLRRARDLHPDDFWIAHRLGTLLSKTVPHRPEEALPHIHAALALRPDCPWAWHRLGDARYQFGDLEGAILGLERARTLGPEGVGHFCCLGISLVEAGQTEAGIAAHREIIRLDPENRQAHMNLGVSLVSSGRLDDALAVFQRAQQLFPEDVKVLVDLGRALLMMPGRTEESIRTLRKAIRLDEHNAEAHHVLGGAFWRARRFDEAIAAYREGGEQAPGDIQCLVTLGTVYCDNLGEPAKAETIFREAIGLDPSSALAYINLGVALRKQNRLDEAIEAHQRAIELDPHLAHAHLGLGDALGQRGRIDEAIVAHRKAIELDSRAAGAYYSLGFSLTRRGRTDEAVEAFRKVAELNPAMRPRAASGLIEVAIAFYNAGQRFPYVEALIREAIGLAPENALYRANLSLLLSVVGRSEEAIEQQRQAVRLAPENGQFRLRLATLLTAAGAFQEGLEMRRTALTVRLPPDVRTVAEWLDGFWQRLVALEDRMPRVLSGSVTPDDARDRLALALFCNLRQHWATAARLCRGAFETTPRLAEEQWWRLNALEWAALAGCGQGEDATRLDDEARATWRSQALAWWRAELERRRDEPETLRGWAGKPAFADVREPSALAKLPPAEREAWQDLWVDVAIRVAVGERSK